ncbi:viperin family antiviral radical SAM protein [Shewanella sp. UCD-KL21]|uniref:viperin family antiviral radical SAM protein n=1 Tax=Shewanella sp. UCD-KL21 TaxID=1917164 RepID=UPI00097056A9|nr:viperin family antiviral radical SAM protein [Shewanella sp. UCD-KL21]
MSHTKVQELVINFHMTEACNYSCGYCYASWEDNVNSSELHHDNLKVNDLLGQLAAHFLSENPLNQKLEYYTVRINFAGGEPLMLGRRFIDALVYAKSLGFNTSIITNGHFLNTHMLHKIAPHIDMLGISFDTGDYLLASSIGRIDRTGDWFSPEKLIETCHDFRMLNPQGKVKVNTVVNAFNWRENLLGAIEQIQPDKWKLLRVLPVQDQNCTITDEQYYAYVTRHQSLSKFIVEEDNDAMWQSYLMINPEGCFYQNTTSGGGHVQSLPILDVGVEVAFAQIDFNFDAFSHRYLSAQHTPSNTK